MTSFGSVHHVGLTVRSLEKSVAFYQSALGCELVSSQEKAGGYLAQIVGYPGAHVRMAHLRLPGGALILELFEYLEPETVPGGLEPARVGNAHICVVTPNLQSEYQRLAKMGVDFISPPVVVDTGVNAGALGLYLRDPDGITIELLQPRMPERAIGDGSIG